jgi:2-keto-3-deoxy-L-rhamnonate aldolase RhmA
MDLDTAAQICVAALPTGVTPIVRVPAHDGSLAARLLDAGAMGVVMPHVASAADAARVVSLSKYPPLGHRSLTGPLPHLGFQTLPAAEAIGILNRNTLVIVMLETPTALDQAEAIAAVPGVDGLMIGTNDLAAEMGIPGQFGNERIEQAYAAVIAACRRHGKFAGMGGIYDHALMEKYIRMGVRFLLGGSDVALMMSAGRARTGFLQGLPLGPDQPAPNDHPPHPLHHATVPLLSN